MSDTAAAGFGVGGGLEGASNDVASNDGEPQDTAPQNGAAQDWADVQDWATGRFGAPVPRPGSPGGKGGGPRTPCVERPDRPGRAAPGEALYAEDLGAEICSAVASGRSLRSVCRDPGRPHRTTVKRWARAHPAFDVALRAAYGHARVSSRMRDRQAAAALALARAEAGPPARGGKASSYTPKLGEVICRRLEAGETLTAIARDPDLPCYGTVFGWLKRHPDFEARYVAARQAQAERLMDEARDAAEAAKVEDVRLWKFRFDVIRWQDARVAARKYREQLEGMAGSAGGSGGAAAPMPPPDGFGLKVRPPPDVAGSDLSSTDLASTDPAALGARKPEVELVFYATHFEIGPGNKVLAVPPRNAQEAQAWIDSTGAPYPAGEPNAQGRVRPPMDTPQTWAIRDAFLAGHDKGYAAGRQRRGS